MLRVNRYVALAFVVTANVGVSSAENHPGSFGQYSTAVGETRLFVSDNATTTLRCDLFFSATGSDQTIVAPKGSVVNQTVPAFVWQYSGLLPVTDYLKTVAIHSTSSERKENSWQDVQLAFYNGLRVEGVREADAKIAYAGAYAFAPRWPLVELIDIVDPMQDENSKLYKVKYTPVGAKGVSVAEYQTLAQDILSAPERVSLQDIRGVIDAADSAKAMKADHVVGSSIDSLFASNNTKVKMTELPETEQQPVMEKIKEVQTGTSLDDLFSDDVILPDVAAPGPDEMPPESVEVMVPPLDEAEVPMMEEVPEVAPEDSVEVMVPQMEELVAVPTQDLPEDMVDEAMKGEVMGDAGKAILGPEDPLIVDVVVDDTDPEAENEPATVKVDTSLGAQPTVWKTLPDGSVVLVQIEG